MANEQHLALLREGLDNWQEWKKNNPEIKPDLSGADLSRIYLNGVDLSNANLIGVNLSRATLSGANLSGATLSGANLSAATLWEADLQGAYINAADVSKANLSEAYLNGTNFCNANLSKANLSGANLNKADFLRANLQGTNLSRTQALSTNFKEVILTGAYLEDWNINSDTNLDGVICDYVYLHASQKSRHPQLTDFAVGEFTQLFQKINPTINLMFPKGINWQVFAKSFKNTLLNNADKKIIVESLKKEDDGIITIKISINPESNFLKIHEFFMQNYEELIKNIENPQITNIGNADINGLFDLISQVDEKSFDVTNVKPHLDKSNQPNTPTSRHKNRRK